MVTCDNWGTLILWKNRAGVLAFEYRISNLPNITDIQWSRCGGFFFTCSKDGHVQLVAARDGRSIFTQQIVSTSRISPSTSLTCCSWNHNNTAVVVGTTNGEIVEISVTDPGALLSSSETRGVRINSLDWYRSKTGSSGYTAYLTTGDVVHLSGRSDLGMMCVYISTFLTDGAAKWNHKEGLLAVVGVDSTEKILKTKILSCSGKCLMTLSLPRAQVHKSPQLKKSLSIAWEEGGGLYVAHQSNLHFVQVNRSFPSLSHLCLEVVRKAVVDRAKVDSTSLPHIIWKLLLDTKNISGIHFPLSLQPLLSWEPLFQPLPQNVRLHCTINQVPSCTDNQQQYILNLEHCGTVLPMLQATVTTSKISPFNVNFSIKATSSLMFLASRELWAQCLSFQCEGPSTPPRRSSFCRKVLTKAKQLFRRRDQLSDAGNHTEITSNVPRSAHCHSGPHPCPNVVGPPILASATVNTVSLRSTFVGNFPSFSQIGTLSIDPNYFKNEPRHVIVTLPPLPGCHDRIMLQSKKPSWNQQTSVYELDFGGRVNRDSVKNFQLEFNGELVLQFGRLQGGLFCLDFDSPLSPIQAFCIGMACIV
jgi:hypothetical protein